MDTLGGILLYSGLICAALGFASLIYPLRFLGIRTRKRGCIALLLGLLAFTTGVYLPAHETRIAAAGSRLDEYAPVFQFREFHSTVVAAPKDRVYAAIKAVRPGEIRFFKTLMAVRLLGSPRDDRPIIESFTSGWFHTLADEPGREIVFGRAGNNGRALPPEQFRTSRETPLLKIAMNFRIAELDATHCLVTTETRVHASGGDVLHGFAAYWRMIRPGSALIRRMWLRAIKLRAEAA
jgi:hypothetical protein